MHDIDVFNQTDPVMPSDQGPGLFVGDLKGSVTHNDSFRNTLWTGAMLQLVMMSVRPGEEIGLEAHHDNDQFLYFLERQCLVISGDGDHDMAIRMPAFEGFAAFIPAGTRHNIVNTGIRDLKLFTVYAPPEHPAGTTENRR